MDFFEHQARARRSTAWLVIYFVVAVTLVILAVYAAAIGITALIIKQSDEPVAIRWWNPEMFFTVAAATLLIIISGSLYKIYQINGSGENVATSLGGRQVPANTRDLSERILLNVVEEMALASGTPVPPVYLLNDEEGINAFAAGSTPQNAVIGVTRGAIKTLNRDQLQGVIAHEFSHVLNGDMRLNIRLMGWLHGILIIALIGHILFRSVGNMHHSSSRSSSGDKKGQGGLALALIVGGIALLIIGYVGVFFAQLIKAAISRQREFLADASAVQFTRNPPGIANALKKIGGWSEHARVRAPEAEEASHMFFGSAQTSNLFATHPPLLLRVQRIDPQFTGPFPTTTEIVHSTDELIDPRSLSMQRSTGALASSAAAPISGFTTVHQAAVQGAERAAGQPSTVVHSVGKPRAEHIDHAHALVDDLALPLKENLRDPLGALATVYALLLSQHQSELRSQQLQVLSQNVEPRVLAELARVQPAVDRLEPEQRLPTACLALPALHHMSPPQVLEFQNVAQSLIRIDKKTTLFEFALQRFIAKRVVARLRNEPQRRARQRPVRDVESAFVVVLSTLASVGDPSNIEAAFDVGLAALDVPLSNTSMLTRDALNLQLLDQSLDALAEASLQAKKSMLASFAACITADSHMSVQEGELLRVIADALGCPMPPIV